MLAGLSFRKDFPILQFFIDRIRSLQEKNSRPSMHDEKGSLYYATAKQLQT